MSYDWPILDAAKEWLRKQNVLTERQLERFAQQAGIDASAAAGAWGKQLQDRVGEAMQESFNLGEGSLAWRDRVQQVVDITNHEAEAVSRTYAHRAQQEGLDEVMSDPIVGELFPYLLYQATQDTRVRPTHAAMDGKVAYKDSPLAAEMRKLHAEWNCRCTLAPLSEEDAKSLGITDNTGAPPPEKGVPEKTDEEPQLSRGGGETQPRAQQRAAPVQQFQFNETLVRESLDKYRDTFNAIQRQDPVDLKEWADAFGKLPANERAVVLESIGMPMKGSIGKMKAVVTHHLKGLQLDAMRGGVIRDMWGGNANPDFKVFQRPTIEIKVPAMPAPKPASSPKKPAAATPAVRREPKPVVFDPTVVAKLRTEYERLRSLAMQQKFTPDMIGEVFKAATGDDIAQMLAELGYGGMGRSKSNLIKWIKHTLDGVRLAAMRAEIISSM